MPTYMFKCRVCGFVKEEVVSYENRNKPIKCCLNSCGGKMDMVVEKKVQFHVYRERPKVLRWKRERGL